MNIRRCNPLYGYGWLREGLRLLRSQPWAWLALVAMGLLATTLLGTLPLLGPIVVLLLLPGLTAGLMFAARAAERGEPLHFGHLVTGLRETPRPLLALGGVNVLALLLASLLFALGWGEDVRRLVELLASPKPDHAVVEEALTQLTLPALLVMALLLPLAMANWFAPALVVFRDLGPGEALRLSLSASLVNFWPFLVYGVLLFLLDAFLSLLLQGVVAVIAAVAGARVAGVLGLLLAFPVLCAFAALIFASVYASYRDVFDRATPGENGAEA
jgi:hypothetical protein